MTFGMHNSLNVVICDNAKDATNKGYVYRKPKFKPIAIKEVVVVRGGTQEGRSTADLILVDEDGQHYAAMVTTALLQSIPHFEDGPKTDTIKDKGCDMPLVAEWVMVFCVAFSTETGVCGQLRQVRLPDYATCDNESRKVGQQKDVSFAHCRPVREPELVK